MPTMYSCDGCRGTLGPAGCPIHANTAGPGVTGVVGAIGLAAANSPRIWPDELALCVEPIEDLLRYLTCKPTDVPSYTVYRAVWDAGRHALDIIERLARSTT